ncbi:hypothetical protein K470DRAFT_272435 [Piedraia hortae CBS 480.64]|uniref:Uncharacterized protein n=1 Tax=Piedraia hortae CBS 480.64 TaxID=1314780 RepID=A0A6A7BT48_9PEZI|nr:hypothetical protein K470DRAFT_272435 [Piedraia hortae CBS 480.64]
MLRNLTSPTAAAGLGVTGFVGLVGLVAATTRLERTNVPLLGKAVGTAEVAVKVAKDKLPSNYFRVTFGDWAWTNSKRN